MSVGWNCEEKIISSNFCESMGLSQANCDLTNGLKAHTSIGIFHNGFGNIYECTRANRNLELGERFAFLSLSLLFCLIFIRAPELIPMWHLVRDLLGSLDRSTFSFQFSDLRGSLYTGQHSVFSFQICRDV